jgi:signal transduction histidine kinase
MDGAGVYQYEMEAPVSFPPQRVVSLVPSITESLFDLGVGDRLIAISDYCTRPAERVARLPRIGGTKNPAVDQIIALEPELVFANQEENRPEDVEQLRNAGIPVWVTFPRTVRDAFNVLWNIMHIFDEAGYVERVRAMEWTCDWLERLDESRPHRTPVFAPIWLDPLMTFNRETYIHDLLRVCGGNNVFAERERRYPLGADLGEDVPYPADDSRIPGRDTRYPRISFEELEAAQPEVILLPDEPFVFGEKHVSMNEIVHDLKAPITAVKGFIELVQLKGELNPDQEHYSQRATQALERMEEMVNGLLDIAWIDSERPLDIFETDLSGLIQSIVDMLAGQAEQQQVHVTAPRSRKALIIESDSRRLESAIQNLLSNAIKYNKPNGEVRINLRTKRHQVIISVEDTGKGIPPEDLPYIFDRYYRSPRDVFSSVPGTGLGLAIAKAVIEKHGGTVSASSVLGNGTVFTVTLPRWQAFSQSTESDSDVGDVEPATLPHIETLPALKVRLEEESADGVDDAFQEPETVKELTADHPLRDSHTPE